MPYLVKKNNLYLLLVVLLRAVVSLYFAWMIPGVLLYFTALATGVS